MDDYTVPILTENRYSNTNNVPNNHKDFILATENSTTATYSYENQKKSEGSVGKCDFGVFPNCTQQSPVLDQPTVLDRNIDIVPLEGFCDLKFSSTSLNECGRLPTVLHFKTNAVMNNSESVPAADIDSNSEMSFAHLLFARSSNDLDSKSIKNSIASSSSRYVLLKSSGVNESVLSTSEVTTCDSNIMGFDLCNTDVTTCRKNDDVDNQSQNMDESNAPVSITYNDRISTNYPELVPNKFDESDYPLLTSNNMTTVSNINSITSNVSTANISLIYTNVDEITSHVSKDPSVDFPMTGSNCYKKDLSIVDYKEIKKKSLGKELQRISPVLSSDSLSESSSDENFEDVLDDCNGYQDTTSSHSHQSASGGGSAAGASASNVGGVSLLNGVGVGVGGNNNPNSSASGYMSLLPPTVGSASSTGSHIGGTPGGTNTNTSGEGIDFKHLFEELCPVCGDKVSGYHYGLLTCESCKGFFKRTVQNKKVYTCVAERSCHIDKTQRKRCPFCRFQKCLEVGMKLEAVRADRMRGGRNKFGPMYKRDRARKLQIMRQRQLALQALRTSIGPVDMKSSQLSPAYQQAYSNMNIKQEIQIPQVSSLTQSPDSSPSPIAIALGQVNTCASVIATPMNSNSGGGGGGEGVNNNSSNNSNNNGNDGLHRGSSGHCQETGAGSLQNISDSKMCFDSGSHPSSTADSIIEPLRVSPMIRDFVQSIDDREWQTQLFALLQKQTYNQVEVDLFELMCKVLDQNLFSQVDWARNTVFFKDLKVDDQMKLLQHSWSDMLVLDHLHQRIHNGLPDETQLNNGQAFNLLWLGLLGVPQLADYFNELQIKLQDLKFDMGDYVCMKFLILLNPDVRGIINKKTVLEGHENVQAALLDYTLTCYPSVTDKFRRLLNMLPDIHAMAARGEEHLYSKHCAGSAPTQTLLMEMLHAKRKV